MNEFTQLDAWKEGHKLVIMVYTITKKFPKEEMFGLTSQIRRAVVSITSNIAEGFGRQSVKEKVQFYSISAGSIMEVRNQILIAQGVTFISPQESRVLLDTLANVHKLVNGLLRSTRARLSPNS